MKAVYLIASLVLAGCASDVRHTGVCGARDIVTAFLTQYGETATGAGADEGHGTVVEFWAGPHSWTVLSTNRFEASCLLASGRDWRERS